MYLILDIKMIIKAHNQYNIILKFNVAVADVICHALVLTRKVIIVNFDGNKMVYIVS